jgi:type IV pilus assembly protein PilB
MTIIEQMVVTEEIQAFLRGDVEDVNPLAIEAVARKAGMVTLAQDGILKAIAGQTTVEEINRVI